MPKPRKPPTEEMFTTLPLCWLDHVSAPHTWNREKCLSSGYRSYHPRSPPTCPPRPPGWHARVIHQNINFPESFQGLFHHGGDLRSLANITFYANGFAPQSLDFCHRARPWLPGWTGHRDGVYILANISNNDICTFLGHSLGCRQTIAPGPSGDNSHFSLKFHVNSFPQVEFFIMLSNHQL